MPQCDESWQQQCCGARLPRAGVQPPPCWLLVCYLLPINYTTQTPLKGSQASIRWGGLWGPHISYRGLLPAAFPARGTGTGFGHCPAAGVLGMGSRAAIRTRWQSRREEGVRKLPAPHAHTCCLKSVCPGPDSWLVCPHPAAQCGCGAGDRHFRGSTVPVIRRHKGAEGPPPLGSKQGQGEARKVGNGLHLPCWNPCPSPRGKEQGGTAPCQGMGVSPAPRCQEPRPPLWAAQGSAASPCCAPLCSPTPWGAAMWPLRVPIPAPCWASPHLGWGSGRKR